VARPFVPRGCVRGRKLPRMRLELLERQRRLRTWEIVFNFYVVSGWGQQL